MSVRAQAGPHSGVRLREVLASGAAHAARAGVEYDVFDSSGALFGRARWAGDGHVFVAPGQLRGVTVHAPMRVSTVRSIESDHLAIDLAEVLSSALGR